MHTITMPGNKTVLASIKEDSFLKYGKPAIISSFFGGKSGYFKAVQEPEDAIYMDEVG